MKLITLTSLHLKDKYCTFHSLHFYQGLQSRKLYNVAALNVSGFFLHKLVIIKTFAKCK